VSQGKKETSDVIEQRGVRTRRGEASWEEKPATKRRELKKLFSLEGKRISKIPQ